MGEGLCPFEGGVAGSLSNTMSRSRGLPPYQVHLDPCSRLAAIDVVRKLGAPPPFWGGARSPSNTVTWAEAYLRAKCLLDPSSRLATINMGQKFAELRPHFWGGGMGPHVT